MVIIFKRFKMYYNHFHNTNLQYPAYLSQIHKKGTYFCYQCPLKTNTLHVHEHLLSRADINVIVISFYF